jgi:hypothetical protein
LGVAYCTDPGARVYSSVTPQQRTIPPGITIHRAGRTEPSLWKGCAMCYPDAYRDDTGTVGPFVAGCYCGWSDNGHPTMESAERAAARHEQNAAD